MAIPSFPSQDLAKLVLGYLAEEQLMTAYDEFLQASPYLDALRNEYDRIFMTSLKNILAEYRAVKIYVETCKPISLRRRLFGCPNLLEVVKFLVSHVDVNKLCKHEASAGTNRSEIGNVTVEQKNRYCAVCNSLRLVSCVCRSNNASFLPSKSGSLDEITSGSSVEATALEDLPGNNVTTKKKQVKVLEKNEEVLQFISNSTQNSEFPKQSAVVSIEQSQSHNISQCSQSNNNHNILLSHNNVSAKPTELESSQKFQEFNEIYNTVCTNSIGSDKLSYKDTSINALDCKRVSDAGTFQDFATGVSGGDNRNCTVPDSSTSENINTQTPITKEIHSGVNVGNNYKGLNNTKILFKVGSVRTTLPQTVNERIHLTNAPIAHAGPIKPKPSDNKITILSDIKVDTINDNQINIPPVLKTATSTPVMQMQTILINGMPAYKQTCADQLQHSRNYTKDEIMAMPTIILVPTSGPSTIPVNSQPQSSQNNILPPRIIPSRTQTLGPLTIDVSTNSISQENHTCITDDKDNELTTENNENGMLIKAVEMKNASVPKDNVLSEFDKSTPQILPPLRKSSSTPRRTSHVRVLDFTTPRRILKETIDEHVETEASEVIISRCPSLPTFMSSTKTGNDIKNESVNVSNNVDANGSDSTVDKNNDKVICKKSNWDADLRALVVGKEKDAPVLTTTKNKSKLKTKSKCKRFSLAEKKVQVKENVTQVQSSDKQKSKKKSSKSVEIIEDSAVLVEESANVPVKPNINIITAPDWTASQENENKQANRLSNEVQGDTPEMDRLSLQNAIGVKLNISDLLETPYKQALYDIQMETPRFLGPDIPGEPLSDIKIMNIPTPRFLDTPKPAQFTPSSYSSRPTDYSSGGSYYKPDEQDYLPLGDLGYPDNMSLKENIKNPNVKNIPDATSKSNCKDRVSMVKSRPVRKCTKNVSYYNSPNPNSKIKGTDDKLEVVSTCSDTMSINSCSENIGDKDLNTKNLKENKPKMKSEPKKKNNSLKKRKTPVKRESSKSFMKIKPRRPTPPIEYVCGKNKRKTIEVPTRKRTNSREKVMTAAPMVLSAPSKSRRKSSTPRKLHCTKIFNSESSGHDSPDLGSQNKQTPSDHTLSCVQDSDTEQLRLRWSDDGSQDVKSKEPQVESNANEIEDITKIQEYIAITETSCKENESNLHVDLVKRGFDIETAKIIERDLLDTPPHPRATSVVNVTIDISDTKKDDIPLEKTILSDSTHSASLNIEEVDDDENDEIELSIHECNEDTSNYITFSHDTRDTTKRTLPKLKDKFSMEVCIDDGVTIRLRATPCTSLFENDTVEVRPDYDFKETEIAVSSISNIAKLYTPMKDSIKAQCYELFDSTLTSLDTPLKACSPKECETTVTQIVLEVEKIEVKDKVESKKRKRLQSGDTSDDPPNETKRAKPEAQYLLNSAIQNIDIETVLCKLHGP